MEHVVVKIGNTALFKLFPEKPLHVRLLFQVAEGQLIRQNISVSGPAIHQGLFYRSLALVFVVHVGSVKIGKSPFHKGIHHLADLLQVHRRRILLI